MAASDAGLLAAFFGLYKLASAFGVAAVVKAYGVPYMIVNFWLVLITLLQHTHPALPHFDDREWEWLRGAPCGAGAAIWAAAHFLCLGQHQAASKLG